MITAVLRSEDDLSRDNGVERLSDDQRAAPASGESVSEEVCDRVTCLRDCEMNNINEIAEATECVAQLTMDTDLAERDYELISAGGAYQEEGIMEEESEESLHKALNSCFSRSHFEIGGLTTARMELGVSIYPGHMLAEDVWVRRFRGGESEAVIYNFDEARV